MNEVKNNKNAQSRKTQKKKNTPAGQPRDRKEKELQSPLSAGRSHKAMEQKRVVLTKRSEQPFVKHSGNAKMPEKEMRRQGSGADRKVHSQKYMDEERNNRRKQPKQKRIRNKEFTRITYVFVSLFLVMMGYIVYFNAVKAKMLLIALITKGRKHLQTELCAEIFLINPEMYWQRPKWEKTGVKQESIHMVRCMHM